METQTGTSTSKDRVEGWDGVRGEVQCGWSERGEGWDGVRGEGQCGME